MHMFINIYVHTELRDIINMGFFLPMLLSTLLSGGGQTRRFSGLK